jgi:hypothetical protein
MPDVLPRLEGIIKIIVSSEEEIPSCCQACRLVDQSCFHEWFCALTGKRIDLPRAKPEWCPIMVKGSTEELLFTFRNMSEKEKERVTEKKKAKGKRKS